MRARKRPLFFGGGTAVAVHAHWVYLSGVEQERALRKACILSMRQRKQH